MAAWSSAWRCISFIRGASPLGPQHALSRAASPARSRFRLRESYGETSPRRGGDRCGRDCLPGRLLDGKDVGEVKRAKDDGRLPMEDYNTRILVVGCNAAEARFVAQALVREAFHNVNYFNGSVEGLRTALARR